jgi:hypothetical protein
VYHVGEPVQITFTETNTGDEPLMIDPNLLAFNITLDGNWVWDNYSSCESQTILTLQPGQSYSKTVTWDGIPDGVPYDGGSTHRAFSSGRRHLPGDLPGLRSYSRRPTSPSTTLASRCRSSPDQHGPSR